jgi:hypothetical protein
MILLLKAKKIIVTKYYTQKYFMLSGSYIIKYFKNIKLNFILSANIEKIII